MWRSLIPLLIFSVAFALTESATAYYLKSATGIYSFNFLSKPTGAITIGPVFLAKTTSIISISHNELFLFENWRETATMVMLFGVALLAGRGFNQKLGAFLISFAVWDIFYYIFLKAFSAWPKSLWDTDVFLINPVAVVGPVAIALIFSIALLTLGLVFFFKQKGGLPYNGR